MPELSLGVVGVSEGNGHPYSFASIVNGYDDDGFEQSEWGVIHEYLQVQDESEFGFPGVEVTHAWTQFSDETETLCEAANIGTACDSFEELARNVDAVIIARDDPESHAELALPLLQRDIPTFVDKPLTVEQEELRQFRPYLEDGLLMSCSGMRYATELDSIRARIDDYGDLNVISGTIIKDWERYGVHLLDAIFNVAEVNPVRVRATPAHHDSVSIELAEGGVINIDAIGQGAFSFDLGFYGSEAKKKVELTQNFTAFRRTLFHFIQQVRTGEPSIPPKTTLEIMKTIVAGNEALKTAKPVGVSSITI